MQVFVTDINSDGDVVFDFVYDDDLKKFQEIIGDNNQTPNKYNASMVKVCNLKKKFKELTLQRDRLYELEDAVLKNLTIKVNNIGQQFKTNNPQNTYISPVLDSFLIAYRIDADERCNGLLNESNKYISRKEYYKELMS